MLPVILALLVVIIKIQTAIQISIVNQKYARGRALFLSYNNPVYPHRGLAAPQLEAKGYNRMVIGVSDNSVTDEEGVSSYTPRAITQTISRSASTAIGGSNEDKAEPDRRNVVRVRTTVALCTPSWVVRAGGQYAPISAVQDSLGSDFTPAAYAYCRSPRDE